MINFPERLATDLSSSLEGIDVYSNVDPTREWNGAATVEINTNSTERTPLITSGFYVNHNVVIACRAGTYDEANTLAETTKDALFTILTTYKTTNVVLDWVFTAQDVQPDVLGINEGASFYGLINITLTTREV